MKPIVGVMPLWDEDKDSMWMLPGYLEGILQAGGIPIIFPFLSNEQELNQLMEMCDGFLLTGGHDISPEIYHEEPMEGLIDSCPKRDLMESVVLKRAIEEDIPVLGICRGLQFINAVLGGSLYQDLPTQYPSKTRHRQKPPYDLPVHEVDIVEGSPLHGCLKMEKLPVNSCHHQGVKRVAEGLEVMATSTDGIVEAVYKPDHHFLWAVQWHPEFSYKTDTNSMKIFRAFIDAITDKK